MPQLSTPWSLVTCRMGTDGPDIAAVQRGDGSIVQPDLLRPYGGLFDAVQDWDAIAPALAELTPDELDPLPGAVAVASLRYPRKLLCVGANYYDHVAEMGTGNTVDATGWKPFFFMVPATTTIIGNGEIIRIPADPTAGIDWEAELAIVIGIGGRDIAPERALQHVAGYACFSDITARGFLRRPNAFADPFRWDWTGSKGLDTFCPIGAVTPAWMISDPNNLRIRCLVNGVLKQDSTTANFISDVASVIAAASRIGTLEPGDVIATGTPAGVGHPRGEHLQAGDEVRVEIEGLFPLTNPVAITTPLSEPEPLAAV